MNYDDVENQERTYETPHGTITLLPISDEEMEKMKEIMLTDPELDLDLVGPRDPKMPIKRPPA
jgi:hypothetical protein